MYKKIHKRLVPLEAEHMAVDTGTDQTTGWDCKPCTDPEGESSYMEWRFSFWVLTFPKFGNIIFLNYANYVNKRYILNWSTCKTPCHAKTPSTGIFLSQTEPMMCSTQLKGQRWQAGVLNLIFSHLDSTRPLPFMIIKPIYIEKLYREDCHTKLSRMSYFQSIVPLQKREGIMSSGRTWCTFMSHKSIKSSSITSCAGKTTKIYHVLSCLLAKKLKKIVDKIYSPMAYRLARYSPILTTNRILHKYVLIQYVDFF